MTLGPFPLLAGFLLLIALGTGHRGISQELLPESVFYDCARNSYSVSGSDLDSLMQAFESELMDRGLLEDRGAESYRGLLQRVASGQRLVLDPDLAFGTRLAAAPRDTLQWKACLQTLESLRANQPDATFTRFLDRRDAMIQSDVSPELQASILLDLLGVEELEQAFYRLHTYYLLDRQAAQPDLTDTLPGNFSALMGPYPPRGANVFRIYLNERGETIVEDRLLAPEQLAAQLSRHARRFGPDALYIIDMELDVKYRQFISLKDRIALSIHEVRDQFARRIYGRTLLELSEGEKSDLENRFPLRVVTP